jgi:Flp pilus assembly protein TadG
MGLLRFSKRKQPRDMFRAGGNKLRMETAQALVELAVSLPILALVTFGAVEMGNLLYASISLSDAAMAGVQYGTRNPTAAADTQGIENAAAADAPNLTLITTPSISCICSNGSASTCQPTDCSGSNIETILTVQTQATVDPLVHVPGFSKTFTLQAKAIQKVLQ